MTRVLVTGGAGFIGSHLVERLVDLGCAVTVQDDLSTGRAENLAAIRRRIAFNEGAVSGALRRGALDLRAFDTIVHLAANAYVPWSVENPAHDCAANLATTFDLLEALRLCRGEALLVNMSSGAVYGDPAAPALREDSATVPISPYGVSKLAGERYADVYSRCFGVRAVSLRLFSAYGPRQRKQVVFDLVRKCRENPRHLPVHGDGTQQRDFIFVTDVVKAVLTVAARSEGRGEVYNVASGRVHAIGDLVAAVCASCGVTPEVAFSGQVRTGDAERWAPDIGRLTALGFAPDVDLPAGVDAVRRWYDDTVRA